MFWHRWWWRRQRQRRQKLGIYHFFFRQMIFVPSHRYIRCRKENRRFSNFMCPNGTKGKQSRSRCCFLINTFDVFGFYFISQYFFALRVQPQKESLKVNQNVIHTTEKINHMVTCDMIFVTIANAVCGFFVSTNWLFYTSTPCECV